MIDFTNCPKKNKSYAGANGNKLSVVFDGEQYMLKFPPHPTKNKDISYTNGCVSEYLGCQIYQSIGIPVQETILGTYSVSPEKQKIVVACKDFTQPGIVLQDFASLKNQIIDSERNGYGTELSDIMHTIESQTAMDTSFLMERFWDMFIVDALIGNWDRHNGNWGFLYNSQTDEIELAPVYDCGSCLYPQADETLITNILSNKSEMDYRIFQIPTSAIKENDKKINYYDFITSFKQPECVDALQRVFPKINMTHILKIVDNTPTITDLQKKFYKTMLTERYKQIIREPYLLYVQIQAKGLEYYAPLIGQIRQSINKTGDFNPKDFSELKSMDIERYAAIIRLAENNELPSRERDIER